MQLDCVHVKVAAGSSDVQLRTDPRTLASVYEETLISAFSATAVLCEINLSGAYWFICRLLPHACHSPGLRLCVCSGGYMLPSDWVSWAEKPCHLILHGMCCTKFGISVESSRGRWGTMGGKLSTLDCQFKLNTALYYSNRTSTNQFLNPVTRVQICLNCIFSTHFTQSTEIYFWLGKMQHTWPPQQ